MTPELKTIKIGQPAHRALEAAGIETVLQLCEYTEKELLALHGMGPKALGILKVLLVNEGLSFRQ